MRETNTTLKFVLIAIALMSSAAVLGIAIDPPLHAMFWMFP